MGHLHLESEHLLELMERQHDRALTRLAAHVAEVCPLCQQAMVDFLREGRPAAEEARRLGGHLDNKSFRRWLRADDDPLALRLALHQASLCVGCCGEAREAFELYSAGLLSEDFLIAEEEVPLGRTRYRAPALMAELEALPPEAALTVVRSDHRFHGWGLAELLCDRSGEVAGADPDLALLLANLAVSVSENVDLAGQPQTCADELRMLAYANRGNALRVREELACAREAFEQAEEHWAAASVRAFSYRAETLSLRASFERYERRYDDCLSTVTEALWEVRRAYSKPQGLEARLLVKQALVLAELNLPAEAVEAAVQALDLVDPATQPRLWLAAAQVQIFFLPELGAYDQAAELLPRVVRMAGGHGSPAEKLKVEWAMARVERGKGNIEAAIQLMRNVCQGFQELRQQLTAAVASLELATFYFDQGKLQHVRRLALEMFPVFQEKGIHREAMATLAILQQAAAT